MIFVNRGADEGFVRRSHPRHILPVVDVRAHSDVGCANLIRALLGEERGGRHSSLLGQYGKNILATLAYDSRRQGTTGFARSVEGRGDAVKRQLRGQPETPIL